MHRSPCGGVPSPNNPRKESSDSQSDRVGPINVIETHEHKAVFYWQLIPLIVKPIYMDISVKDLQEAISIRQQIDNLQRRLSSLLRGAAKTRGTGGAAPGRRKGQLTPAGRRRLSQLMKARWAARRKAGGKQKPSRRKKGALTYPVSDTWPPPRR